MLELYRVFLNKGLELLTVLKLNFASEEKERIHLEFGLIGTKNIPRNFCTGVIFARSVL
jgi:hypothetical protein